MNNGNKDETRAGMISFISRNVNVNKLPLCLRSCEAFTDLGDIVEWVVNRKISHDLMVARFAKEKTHVDSLDIQPGSYLLDHYRILNQIGRGGMSTVYLAYDELRDKSVAVKVASNSDIMSFDSIVQSLNAEVDILKRLVHPYLPRIYDVIEKTNLMIIIMDFIEGRTLQSIINEYGALPEDQVIKTGKQLCEALKYIHSLDPPIIYRDMKPSNIMVRPNGDIMLIDFGSAKEYDSQATSDTVCLGTMGYAAPEQFGGMGQSDARTDIYGLGITLYHAVTGFNPAEPPYEIRQIRDTNPALSKELEFIIGKATQRDPAERFQTVDEMLYCLNNPSKIKTSGNGFLSRLFKKTKRRQDNVAQRSVPLEVEKRLNDILPKAEKTGYVFGSGDTSILSSNSAPATEELQIADKLISASELLTKTADTDLINSVAAVCISMPDKIVHDTNGAVYLYIFTALSADKVKKRIVKSGYGANVKNEKLILIPKDSIISVTLKTDQIRFEKTMIRFQWNGKMCFSRIRIEKILSSDHVIPVEASISIDGKELRSVIFEISK